MSLCRTKDCLNKLLTEFILGQRVINNSISGDGADGLITHHREKEI